MDKWLLPLAIVLAAVMTVMPLPAQDKPTFTGNDFRQASGAVRIAYVAGYADGILASSYVNPTTLPVLVACLATKPYGQLTAIVEQYLTDNPKRWDETMTGIPMIAFLFACRRD